MLAWEPPARVVFLWQINADWKFDRAIETEVEVRFSLEQDGTTRVDLEHRDLESYGARANDVRDMIDSPGGWQGLLGSFQAAVDAASNS